MADSHEIPHDTPRQRSRLSTFVLRLQHQNTRWKAQEMSPRKENQNQNPLHNLPPELRYQIFKPLLVNWKRKTPNLIKSLRPDQRLYHEALEIFYKKNIFVFHQENDWSFGDMTKEAVLSIEKAAIHVEPEIMSTGLWKVGSNKEESLIPDISATLSDARNIREVTLMFEQPSNDTVIAPFIEYGNISYSASYFLVNFERLQRVQISIPQPWFRRRDLETLKAEREARYTNGIKMVNDRLGVFGKLLTVPALQIEERYWGRLDAEDVVMAMNSSEGWFWQAVEGTFLRTSKMRGPPTSTPDNTTHFEL